MERVLSLILILGLGIMTLSTGNSFSSECKVSCKKGKCEVRICKDNAVCKCNWLGNPVCKCSKKGVLEEIGDIAGEILSPDY